MDINPSAGVTVSINFNAPPALVMVREGVNGPWRAAVQRSLTSYETNVRRPYTVMGVCDDGVASSIQLEARTPSDERTINFSCVSWFEPPPHGIFGSMVQPGAVTVDGVRRFSPASNWPFSFGVESGTYDLIASNTDRVAVRRGLVISGQTSLPPVDLAQEGTALASSSFTVTNPLAGETLGAAVYLVTPNCDPQAQLYSGPLANAKVAPSSVIQAGEQQDVSIRSVQSTGLGNSIHSIRRPYRVGDSTSFTFWVPLKNFAFPTATTPAASWRWRDTMGNMDLSFFEASGDETLLSISKNYLEATGINSFSFRFNAPGFLPEWQPDFSSAHSRSLFLQDVDAQVKTRTINENVEGLAAAGASGGVKRAEARAARWLQQRQL